MSPVCGLGAGPTRPAWTPSSRPVGSQSLSSPIGTSSFLSLSARDPRSEDRGVQAWRGSHGCPPSDTPSTSLRRGCPASAWTLAGAPCLSRHPRPGLLRVWSTANSLGLDKDAEPAGPARLDRFRLSAGRRAPACIAASRSLHGEQARIRWLPGVGLCAATMCYLVWSLWLPPPSIPPLTQPRAPSQPDQSQGEEAQFQAWRPRI